MKYISITALIVGMCAIGCIEKPTQGSTNSQTYHDTLYASVAGFQKAYSGSELIDSGWLVDEALAHLDSIGLDTVIVFSDTLIWSWRTEEGENYYRAFTVDENMDSIYLQPFGFYRCDSLFLYESPYDVFSYRFRGNSQHFVVHYSRHVLIQNNGVTSSSARFGIVNEDSLKGFLVDAADTLKIWDYQLSYQ